MQQHNQQLTQLHNRLERAQQQQLLLKQKQLQPLLPRLSQAIFYQQQQLKQKLSAQVQLLHSLSPLQVLARGYSITQTADGKVIHNTDNIQSGERIRTRLQQGWIESDVVKTQSE